MRTILAAVVLTLILGACTGGVIEVRKAVIAEPVGSNTAMYFELENPTQQPDRLLGARTEVAVAEIHRSFSDGGQIHMERVERVEIGRRELISFEPGGLHVMLFDVEPLQAGEVVMVSLEFETAGEIEVAATVTPYTDIAP